MMFGKREAKTTSPTTDQVAQTFECGQREACVGGPKENTTLYYFFVFLLSTNNTRAFTIYYTRQIEFMNT